MTGKGADKGSRDGRGIHAGLVVVVERDEGPVGDTTRYTLSARVDRARPFFFHRSHRVRVVENMQRGVWDQFKEMEKLT